MKPSKLVRPPYTGKMVEELLGISTSSRYRHMKLGTLPSFIAGGRRVYPAEVVDGIVGKAFDLHTDPGSGGWHDG